MFGKNVIPDKTLLKTVDRKLERTGTGSQSRISASVRQGIVTLIGQLQYENQRMPILKAVRSIAGVRQVIDQLRAPPKSKPHVG